MEHPEASSIPRLQPPETGKLAPLEELQRQAISHLWSPPPPETGNMHLWAE